MLGGVWVFYSGDATSPRFLKQRTSRPQDAVFKDEDGCGMRPDSARESADDWAGVSRASHERAWRFTGGGRPGGEWIRLVRALERPGRARVGNGSRPPPSGEGSSRANDSSVVKEIASELHQRTRSPVGAVG